MPIDLSNSYIDFLVFAGHKNLYASWGIGGFISNSKYPLKPVLSGGNGSDSLNLELPAAIPTGFEYSISFPLISAGIFGGNLADPVSESTKQCCRAYRKFTSDFPEYDIDVKLCAYSHTEMQVAQTVFDQIEYSA